VAKAPKAPKASADKLPGVLSFQRGFVLSDGLFFNLEPSEQAPAELVKGSAVRVIRHGIRGANAHTKPGKDNSNIQRTESAKTSTRAAGVLVQFFLRSLPASELLYACTDTAYRAKLARFIQAYFQPGVAEFDDVCLRYARNILRGSWLWRNRVLGQVSICAQVGDSLYRDTPRTLDGDLFDPKSFTQDEKGLARAISQGFVSPLGAAPVIAVQARIEFGFQGEVEVFPSQNMVTSKPDGFGRSLYKVDMLSRSQLREILQSSRKDGDRAGEFAADMIVMGHAALRDQKIGNALRTIDTWYEGADPMVPIAVEPTGASLTFNQELRSAKEQASALLKRIDEFSPSAGTYSKEAAFLVALIIRGGVFSESKKKDEAGSSAGEQD
jgi:CRISPR-associated protein Csy3